LPIDRGPRSRSEPSTATDESAPVRSPAIELGALQTYEYDLAPTPEPNR